jgi:hypothetical protein
VAGCATSTGFAGPAGATASLKLTFEVGHSPGANQPQRPKPENSVQVRYAYGSYGYPA